jgi:hypothetical protein
MATRNTLYVVRVGTDTPQGDGYTYLRWCDGEDYRWGDRKDALRPQGQVCCPCYGPVAAKGHACQRLQPACPSRPRRWWSTHGLLPREDPGENLARGLVFCPLTL